MKNLNISELERKLREQRASLLDQLATLRGGAISRVQASEAHFANREDSPASSATERDLELALDNRESLELDEIDAALRRITDGSYGSCCDCGADITPARLQAAPEAARCIGCQEKTEQTGNRQTARA